MSFPARYGGRCAGCDLSIFVDDEIEVTDDGVMHEGCASDPAPVKAEPQACTVCWLVHPEGVCDR